jgi:glycosyltransferase involved in cell wall biosynthesis
LKGDRDVLVIFNLETNLDSQVLAMGHSWVEKLAENDFQKVYVYSTHVGRHQLPTKVTVVEIGGGNFFKRLRALYRLTLASATILRNSNRAMVFHHMSVRTVIFPGLLFKLFRIPQGLWYSHSALPGSLKLALKITDLVFTSTRGSTKIESNKLRFVGHGIDYTGYPEKDEILSLDKSGIVSLGRIAKVKNLDKLLISGSMEDSYPKVTFIGPVEEGSSLVRDLKAMAANAQVELELLASIPHEDVASVLSRFAFYYSGTPWSVDKATLEAASVGCIVISEQQPAKELTGMAEEWTRLGFEKDLEINAQLKILQGLSSQNLQDIRMRIIEFTRSRNNVVNTTRMIAEQLRDLK